MIRDLIKERRSVFPVQYIDMVIPKENLQQILESANWAPNHNNTEPWRFKVLQGESKTKLGEFLSKKYQEVEEHPKQVKIKKLKSNPKKSAAVIAICMQRDPKESVPEWEELAAVAMAVQNMWLTCTEMGIGCYWSSPGIIEYMDEFFDLAEGEKCLGFLYMGYYDEELPQGKRKPIKDKVVWLD
ncbi:nitroreductase family protein [Maribacter polysaccharolyticus]|uniref:nitroreductase family protein n=1 Tax=Maribacter polysaccharolyticus TaxID=3020831 RepID=UPI00237FCC91|nr:nitroreductase [Maribacter polysaccharolyticus]MDE3742630.1 nitroreductase [Maribacter polysaccharolyticus]